jgi:hypothetical protein
MEISFALKKWFCSALLNDNYFFISNKTLIREYTHTLVYAHILKCSRNRKQFIKKSLLEIPSVNNSHSIFLSTIWCELDSVWNAIVFIFLPKYSWEKKWRHLSPTFCLINCCISSGFFTHSYNARADARRAQKIHFFTRLYLSFACLLSFYCISFPLVLYFSHKLRSNTKGAMTLTSAARRK